MKIGDIVGAFPALQEFGLLSQVIKPTMVNPEIPRAKKREALNDLVNGLSEKTFSNEIVLNQVMEIINMKEDECKKFTDANSQVDNILTWLPRMKVHRDKLVKRVSQNRKRYGLNVQ